MIETVVEDAPEELAAPPRGFAPHEVKATEQDLTTPVREAREPGDGVD